MGFTVVEEWFHKMFSKMYLAGRTIQCVHSDRNFEHWSTARNVWQGCGVGRVSGGYLGGFEI